MTTTVLEGVRVNVGSGPAAADGWINLDGSWQAWFAGRPLLAWIVGVVAGREVGGWSPSIQCHDVRRRLPFADGSVSIVFASHIVEHLTREDAIRFLRDAHRVLRPGGVCRIIVPDLESAVRVYAAERGEGRPDSGDRLMERLHLRTAGNDSSNPVLRWYRSRTEFHLHKWMYDGAGACRAFEDAGFPAPAVRGFLESDIPREWLSLVERPDRVLDGAGVCVEARREARR